MSDPAENRKIWLKAAEENRALLDGEIGVEWDGGDLLAAKGGSVFVPAGQSVTGKGNADVLLSRV